MKFKASKKQIIDGYWLTISIGYCDLQNLLNYEEPIAYTCGNYGWNADIYQITPNIAIVTGYRPFGNVKANYDLNRKYEKEAGKIISNYDAGLTYDQKKEKVRKLIDELVDLYRIEYLQKKGVK